MIKTSERKFNSSNNNKLSKKIITNNIQFEKRTVRKRKERNINYLIVNTSFTDMSLKSIYTWKTEYIIWSSNNEKRDFQRNIF